MLFCQPFGFYSRFASHEVKIGDSGIGDSNPIRIQSMTNTPTDDIKATVNQSKELFDAGCEFVRITTRNASDVAALSLIRNKLHHDGYKKPLIADVHFNPNVALEAAKIVEKVRINPGNYTDISKTSERKAFTQASYHSELEKVHEAILPLIKVCRQYGTALRLGINHGSLAWRIVEKYGNTPAGMVASAMEFLNIFNAENFSQVVVSMKASNPFHMVYATRLLVHTMHEKGMTFPVHVGVTEAGFGNEGIYRSVMGTGALLMDGIGDTIRVSLSGNPVKEIPVALEIVREAEKLIGKSAKNDHSEWPYAPFQVNSSFIQPESWPKEIPVPITFSESTEADLLIINQTAQVGKTAYTLTNLSDPKKENSELKVATVNDSTDIHQLRFDIAKQVTENHSGVIVMNTGNENPIRLALIAGSLLCDRLICGWQCRRNDVETMNEIFQASGLRKDLATYISCPTCGRTTFELEALAVQIKEKTKHLKNIKIAIMGCIVNGPGEMDDADYGVMGEGGGTVSLYRKNEPIRKKVASEKAAELLLEIICSDRENN